MRLIDADALSESIKGGDGTPTQKFFADVCLAGAPTVDTAPVTHAKWLIKPRGHSEKKCGIVKICSACGWENACRYNYCPICGAKMDLEE